MSWASDCSANTSDWTVAHDFLMTYGGAEWVTQVLCRDTFPGASLVYLAGDPSLASRMASGTRRRLLPALYNRFTYRTLLPTYASLIGRLPEISGNLIASSYAFAHYLRCSGKKVVYCHSPLRQAWSGSASYRLSGSLGERLGLRAVQGRIRSQDRAAAQSANLYVASSRAVRERVRKYYGIDEVLIVPPPVNTEMYRLPRAPREEFFLWVGRVVEPYKRLGLAIEAFGRHKAKRLVVVGDGRSRPSLEKTAPSNVEFVGWKSPAELAKLYGAASALVFPSEDDFGIVPIEAMACGTPVIAYRGGGALDTVVEGESGIFFDQPTSESLTDALRRFRTIAWDEGRISAYATARFSPSAFSSSIMRAVEGI